MWKFTAFLKFPVSAVGADGSLNGTELNLGHPGIEWVENVKSNLWKSGKGRPHCHRLFRFPTGSAAALMSKIVG